MAGEWRFEQHFRRNVAAVAAWEVFWGFGAACVSASIVTAFLSQLTGSKTLIGALSLTNLLALPAIFVTVYLNRRLAQKRRLSALLWSLQVLNWVVLGAGVTLSSEEAVGGILVLLFATHALIHVLNGLVTAPTYEMLAVAFGSRWGTVQGIQVLCNRGLGMAGGLAAAAILDRFAFPLNFGLTFLLGGLLLTLSNAAILAVVEPREYGGEEPPPFRVYLRSLGAGVVANRGFTTFLAVLALLSFVAMAQGFYVVFALERLRLEPAYAGLFTTVAFGANGLGAIVAGPFGDRFGHRTLLLGALALHLASIATVLGMTDLSHFYAGLILNGVAAVAASISTTNLTAEFAPPGEKGGYVAVSRLVSQPATALGTLAGGLLIDLGGFETAFALSLAFPAAAIALTLLSRPPSALPARRAT